VPHREERTESFVVVGGRSWVVVVAVAHAFKEEKENRVESKVVYKEEGSGKIPI